VDARLKRLRQDDIDLSEVVVVTLRDSNADSSALDTKAFARGQLVAGADGGAAAIGGTARLVTVQEFKGLEATHALVVDVDDLSDAHRMSRLYVAMTRPRVSLWLAVGPVAWRQLTEAPKGKPDV
jgi:hypothetical protein